MASRREYAHGIQTNADNMKKWKTKSGCEIFRILSGRSNVFLLTNGEKNILIDTSVSLTWERLQKQLDRSGIKKIDCLILTHAHVDHAANASRIKNKFNALVIIQKEEAGYLLNGSNIVPGGTTLFTRPLVKIFGKRLSSLIKYSPCKYDLLVDLRFDLNDFGFNAYLMHTPGHTAGSMSLIIDDEVAVVGDTMVGAVKWSVFPPFAQDVEQLIQSWGKLLETGCSLFLPAHGTGNNRSLVEKDYAAKIKKYGRQG